MFHQAHHYGKLNAPVSVFIYPDARLKLNSFYGFIWWESFSISSYKCMIFTLFSQMFLQV